jgi:hypothetical protein
MAIPAANRIDLLSWHISVDHPWEAETEDHWRNPSTHVVMREILHESVHFWQAVSTPYLLRLSVGAFRDFLRLRDHAARQSRDGRPVPVDTLKLEDNRYYFLQLHRLHFAYGELSAGDLVEGLARYWDVHLCGARAALERLQAEGKISDDDIRAGEKRLGPFFLPDGFSYSHHLLDFVFEYEARYNRAYKFALERIGPEAFILFPILGFLALGAGSQSVTAFQRWAGAFVQSRPFEIPSGNFLTVWPECFRRAYGWITEQLGEPLYSALTAYSSLCKKMVSWSAGSALAARFGLVTGHGVLDRYLQGYWQWMRERNPDLPKENVELRFDLAFAVPGHPLHRRSLVRRFHPPVVFFEDGPIWRDEVNWPPGGAKPEVELPLFGAMAGAAMALTGEFRERLQVRCPHVDCPWHRTQLCWKVDRFPAVAASCRMPALYREQMLIDLPARRDWTAAEVDRPITRERRDLLALESD